jgi:methylmalonyl-CoA mutase
MTSPHKMPSLTDRFGQPSRGDWQALVTKTLKGGDFRRLVSKTYDGLEIQPVYERRAGAGVIAVTGAAEPWGITVRVDHPCAADAAELATADLEGGANGLALVARGSLAARGFGITIESVDALDAALSGVMLDMIAVRIEPSRDGGNIAKLVAALCERRKHDPARLAINFGLDPIGVMAVAGSASMPWSETAAHLAKSISALKSREFTGPLIVCDLRPYSEAGASDAQELAAGLASGIAYARALESQGMAASEAFAVLSWTVAVDADQFAGMAKLRALRRLWQRVEEASGIASQPIAIHAETAWRMMTQRDPAVNMLRSTLAVFTAATGGANTISVLPHTLPLGLPDLLARRIARNTQLVLQEETNLWRVADPAAGAGAIEALTDQLCEKAWELFQEIEREGGIAESLTKGALQARIAAVAKARFKDVASRRNPITGTSEFPNLSEVPIAVLDMAPLIEHPASATQFVPLASRRLAEPFEQLRDAADAAARAAGKRPQVFLANLGPLAEFGARASWIANLLAAGGIDVISNDGFTSSADASVALAASGASVACICGADATYDLLAEATTMALKAAGAAAVLLAGKPGANEAALKAAGVDQFVFAGQDMIAALKQVHAALGIAGT